ncbi:MULTISPECIES: gamma-carotene 1'-hydroxylase CruF [unclassified Limnothrix]|uniref:gamma-carotene 1'-hydroxylase CruF n=1 Tax=unclassified Limnothrix TaxID=2632864 RepID=UPI0018F006EB|nr:MULTISPECIES: carotenoid biosynthesis protein [unclassified Limnothrix]
MKSLPQQPLSLIERACLIGHIIAMAFGLAGLLYVLPRPDLIASLPPIGIQFFQWSMGQGGVGYIILGAAAVALYLARVLGWQRMLLFFLPSVGLSLGSELLGTSTGFPFGHYHYLSGLGYKVAGLVPFTIPLSWFYMGAVCYLLVMVGLERLNLPGLLRQAGAVVGGAVLLMAWDLVLDPAMSQTSLPFWEFEEIGEFFGMPYRNLSGWVATGMVFMSVAALLWRGQRLNLTRSQLTVPVIVYLVNFAFGAAITVFSLDPGFLVPTMMSVAIGVLPAVLLWAIAPTEAPKAESAETEPLNAPPLEVVAK